MEQDNTCECGNLFNNNKFKLGGKYVCQDCYLETKDEQFRLSSRIKEQKDRRKLKFRDKFAT
jgi:hypothetical protein